MKSPRIAYLVYLLGMVPAAVFYEYVKSASGGGWFFVAIGVVYFALLRALAEVIEAAVKRFGQNRARESPKSDA